MATGCIGGLGVRRIGAAIFCAERFCNARDFVAPRAALAGFLALVRVMTLLVFLLVRRGAFAARRAGFTELLLMPAI